VQFSRLTDKDLLEDYFRQDLPLHAYSLGDLDEGYWQRTSYFGIHREDQLSDVFLIYRGIGLPVLLAMGPEGYLKGGLLEQMVKLVPDEVYAHLSPGLEKRLWDWFSLEDFGPHFKMVLVDPGRLEGIPPGDTFRLSPEDLPALERLFSESYPDNAFDPRMLSSGKYIGCRESGKLVSTAGVHVYSLRYRVAALGNITTHPDYQNRGFARMATARLCRELAGEVDFIGLNVKSGNQAAVHLYQALGFKIAANYGEFCLKKRF
jgi:ribosomal protein S18 acetylase RimI-like enzyme